MSSKIVWGQCLTIHDGLVSVCRCILTMLVLQRTCRMIFGPYKPDQEQRVQKICKPRRSLQRAGLLEQRRTLSVIHIQIIL